MLECLLDGLTMARHRAELFDAGGKFFYIVNEPNSMESCVSNQFAALFGRAQRVGATPARILIARFLENNPAYLQNLAFLESQSRYPEHTHAYRLYDPTIPSAEKSGSFLRRN